MKRSEERKRNFLFPLALKNSESAKTAQGAKKAPSKLGFPKGKAARESVPKREASDQSDRALPLKISHTAKAPSRAPVKEKALGKTIFTALSPHGRNAESIQDETERRVMRDGLLKIAATAVAKKQRRMI